MQWHDIWTHHLHIHLYSRGKWLSNLALILQSLFPFYCEAASFKLLCQVVKMWRFFLPISPCWLTFFTLTFCSRQPLHSVTIRIVSRCFRETQSRTPKRVTAARKTGRNLQRAQAYMLLLEEEGKEGRQAGERTERGDKPRNVSICRGAVRSHPQRAISNFPKDNLPCWGQGSDRVDKQGLSEPQSPLCSWFKTFKSVPSLKIIVYSYS